MLHGDLSNAPPKRLVFVFEDLIATIPEERRRRADRSLSRGKWRSYMDAWRLDTAMVANLHDIFWRLPFVHDIVSLSSSDRRWWAELDEFLDISNVPRRRTEVYDGVLEYGNAILPDAGVLRVYHNTPGWSMKLGHRSELVPDARVFEVR